MKDIFKNKCEIVRDLLPLFADNSCSKEAKDEVALHLITCKNCRDYYKEIKSYHEVEGDDSSIPYSDRHFGEVVNRLRRRKIIRRSLVATAIIASLAINAVLLINND